MSSALFLDFGRRPKSSAPSLPLGVSNLPSHGQNTITKTITTFGCGHDITSFSQNQPQQPPKTTRRFKFSLPFSRTSASTPTVTVQNQASCPDCHAQLEASLQNAALIQSLIRANAEHARGSEGRRNPAPPTKGTAAAIQILAKGENEKRVGGLQNLENSSADLERLGRYLEMEMRVGKNTNPWEAQRVMGMKAQELLDAVLLTTKEERRERVCVQEEEKSEGIEQLEQDDLQSLRSFVGSSPSFAGPSPKPKFEAKSPSDSGYQALVSDHSAEVDVSTPLSISQPSIDYPISTSTDGELNPANNSIPSCESESEPQLSPSSYHPDPSLSLSSTPANSSAGFSSLVETLDSLDALFDDDTKTATPTVSLPPLSSYPSNLRLGSPVPPLSHEEEPPTDTASTSPISSHFLQSGEAEQPTDTDTVRQPTCLQDPIRRALPLGFYLELQERADAGSTAQQQGQEPQDDSTPQSHFSPPSSDDSDDSDPPGDSEETWIDLLEEGFSPPNSPPLDPSSFPLPPSPPLTPLSIPFPLSPPGLTSLFTPAGIAALRTIYAYLSLPMTFLPTKLNPNLEFNPLIFFPRPKRPNVLAGIRCINRSEQDWQRMQEMARLYRSVDWDSAWELEKAVGLRDKGGKQVDDKAGTGVEGESRKGARDASEELQVQCYRTHGLSNGRFPWTTVPISRVRDRGEMEIVDGSKEEEGGEQEGEQEAEQEAEQEVEQEVEQEAEQEAEQEGEQEAEQEGEQEAEKVEEEHIEKQNTTAPFQLTSSQEAELLLSGLWIPL